MSAAYYIVLDQPMPGCDVSVNGKFLSQDAKGLESMAQSLGIPPLETYISGAAAEAESLLEDMGADPDLIETLELGEESWFDPQEGLDWVRHVMDYIQRDPESVTNPEGVLSDLAEFQAVLAQAQQVKARWHLQVDF